MTLAAFWKAVVPTALGLVTLLISWVATGDLSTGELRIAGAALLTSIAVYAVPNIASSPFLKAIVPSFLALVAVFISAVESGQLTEVDVRTALAGLLTSAVVYVVRNESQPILER